MSEQDTENIEELKEGIDPLKIKDYLKTGTLNQREYNLLNGKYRQGQTHILSVEIAVNLFQFYMIGRSLKQIHEISGYPYDYILAVAVNYNWREKKDETLKAPAIQTAIKDSCNNIFLLNKMMIDSEIAKKLQNPDYSSPITEKFVCKTIQDFQMLIKTTAAANELACMLTQPQSVTKVQTNILNAPPPPLAIKATDEKPKELSSGGNNVIDVDDDFEDQLDKIAKQRR